MLRKLKLFLCTEGLHFDKTAIVASEIHQLLMCALFYYSSFVHDTYYVGVFDG